METVKISFDIETSDAECPLGVEIWLDDTVLLTNNHVQEKICFSHDISDDDGEHKLRVVMSGIPWYRNHCAVAIGHTPDQNLPIVLNIQVDCDVIGASQ